MTDARRTHEKFGPARMLVRHPRQRRAVALIVVMVIVLLVSFVAYGFNQQMSDVSRISTLEIESEQARCAALSGVQWMLAYAEASPQDRSQIDVEMQRGWVAVPIDPEEGAGIAEFGWAFSIVSPGPASIAYGPRSESAKLNVQRLREWEEASPGHAKRVLMQFPGAREEFVDAWLRIEKFPGSTARQSLAQRMESQVESQSTDSASPARQWAQAWTGGDWNWNYRTDPFEEVLGGEADFPWRDLLTQHSGVRNENRDGRPRIFLNSMDLPQLHRKLLEFWPPERANFVIAMRQFGMAREGSSNTPRASEDWVPDFSLPARYLLSSPLELVDALVVVESSPGERLSLVSPFRGGVSEMGNYLDSLVDDVTVDPNRVIEGQIHAFEAPAEVLRAIPGIDESVVDRLVQRRGDGQGRAAKSFTVAWLVTEEVLDWENFKTIFPWITMRGDCYSAQVIGFRDENSAVFRGTMIFDGRERPSVVRNFQQWHQWGRGFTEDELRGLQPFDALSSPRMQ